MSLSLSDVWCSHGSFESNTMIWLKRFFIRLLHFYWQSKFINKTEKRRNHVVQENNQVYLTTGWGMHLFTRKRNSFNFLCNRQIYVHVSFGRFQVCLFCFSLISLLPVPLIPHYTVHGMQLPLYPSKGITLLFFRYFLSLTKITLLIREIVHQFDENNKYFEM